MIKCYYCGRFVAYADVHYEAVASWTGCIEPPEDVIVCGNCHVEPREETVTEGSNPPSEEGQ